MRLPHAACRNRLTFFIWHSIWGFDGARGSAVVDILGLLADDLVLHEFALEVILTSVRCQTGPKFQMLLLLGNLNAKLLREAARCYGCHPASEVHYRCVLTGGEMRHLAELRRGGIHLHGCFTASLLFKQALPLSFMLVLP